MIDTNKNEIQDSSNIKFMALGFIGALLGAVIGAVPWAIALYFGWFVGWLGFIIGYLSIKGYELLGGKRGKFKIAAICIATIIGVVLGNVSGYILSIYNELSKLYEISIGDSIRLFFEVMGESDVIGDFLFDLFLGFVFAALGVWTLIKNEIKKTNENEIDVVNQNNNALNEDVVDNTVPKTTGGKYFFDINYKGYNIKIENKFKECHLVINDEIKDTYKGVIVFNHTLKANIEIENEQVEIIYELKNGFPRAKISLSANGNILIEKKILR